MMSDRAIRAIRATADAIETDDTLWRLMVAVFLLAMLAIAYEAVQGLSFLLTALRH